MSDPDCLTTLLATSGSTYSHAQLVDHNETSGILPFSACDVAMATINWPVGESMPGSAKELLLTITVRKAKRSLRKISLSTERS